MLSKRPAYALGHQGRSVYSGIKSLFKVNKLKMNLVLFEKNELEHVPPSGTSLDIQSHILKLCDRRAEHLRNILKVAEGDEVSVGAVNGFRGRAIVVEVGLKQISLNVEYREEAAIGSGIHLIVALPRPQMLKRILEISGTMAVERLDLIYASRVEKSFFKSKTLEPENLHKHLLLGMEQGSSTLYPEVNIFQSLKKYQEEIKSLKNRQYLKLIAHPGTSDNLGSLWDKTNQELRKKIVIAIGPEGGWQEQELGNFKELGFKTFNLGKKILRVETAVTVVIGKINLLQAMSDEK
jgi:16S rRNA (uracil1498-N3)-methyltransferase